VIAAAAVLVAALLLAHLWFFGRNTQ